MKPWPIKNALLLLTTSILLSACGGGSSGGGGGPDDEVVEIVEASAQITKQMISNNNSPDIPINPLGLKTSNPQKGSPTPFDALPFINIDKLVEESDSGSEPGPCGGTLTLNSYFAIDDETLYPVIYDFDFIFDNYCVPLDESYSVFYDGNMSYEFESTTELVGYYDISIAVNYQTDYPLAQSTGSINESLYCEWTNGIENLIESEDCQTLVSYSSDNGDYEAEVVVIEGDNDSGYSIDAVIEDDEGNRYELSFTGLTVCENGNFGTGSGTISYNGDTIGVEFISCDEVVITYQGVSETLAQ